MAELGGIRTSLSFSGTLTKKSETPYVVSYFLNGFPQVDRQARDPSFALVRRLRVLGILGVCRHDLLFFLCNLVQFGAIWCNLVQFGAIWCNLVQFGAI
jgi:hypothetical protein